MRNIRCKSICLDINSVSLIKLKILSFAVKIFK